MNIQKLKTFNIGHEIKQSRMCTVDFGNGKKGVMLAVSRFKNIDPCEASMTINNFPQELIMFDDEGNKIWEKELCKSVVSGVWLFPFIAFDLNCDGVDEIYYLDNKTVEYPLDHRSMKLVGVDSRTGEELSEIPFDAQNTEWDRLGHAYRFMLGSAYVNGEPVLLKTQGIYKDIYIQAYNSDLSLRWSKRIDKEDGSCGSHTLTVLDINGDGIEEIFFGEHILSADDGHELFCLDGERYHGHSDFVLPIFDGDDMYIYTLRENGDYDGCPRVVMFDSRGKIVWEDVYSDEWGDYVDDGHMHYGWIARVKPDYHKIAYAYRRRDKKKLTEHLTYDFLTGNKVDFTYPAPLNDIHPIDINGDGFTEFYHLYKKDDKDYIDFMDAEGNVHKTIEGLWMTHGKFFDYEGEQLVVRNCKEGTITVWGDVDACDGDVIKMRYSNGFLRKNTKKLGCGYNWLSIPNAL